MVLEKTTAPPTGSPTGAGVAIDSRVLDIIGSWIGQPQLPYSASVPLTIDQNQMIDVDRKVSQALTRDENFNFRAVHWADLHGLLYHSLPPDIFFWGHHFLSFTVSEDKTSVNVKAKVLQTDEIFEVDGNLLVAADGSLSSIRHTFLPDLNLRYTGYYAWRGVLDFSGKEESEAGIRRAYPDLGKCLYIDLASKTHSVHFEIPKNRVNWIWYINQPEPQRQRNSLTMRANDEVIKEMIQEAEKVWLPEVVRVMKETKDPFINAIYDCDPLKQIVWDNVVLIGDAAHPVTPHGARSTNMSVIDAVVLGNCFKKWGAKNLHSALEEYQSTRLPVITKQVLHSRRMGRIKQGLTLPDRNPFDPKTASPEECKDLQHKSMPFFHSVPIINRSSP
ncbi:hypothetical protein SLEP1_g49511 [Rubroshorea leprosula]|uniref:FAD-binding domain-containing protein n=1 Tax=Rubroshorea leprosula TaxID=152421 RepID=A0AAV5LY05_9ROSI|nr:hypothetical protein SLEP1_g49511 [Rubroshorea leprosula]